MIQATKGYYKNPSANATLFDRDWLNTGDLRYFAAGELYLTGREKDAGREACGNVNGAAQGNHQVREVAADANLLDEGVDRRGIRVRGIRREGDTTVHPVPDCLHTTMPLPETTELVDRQLHQPV